MEKYICIHGHFYQPPRENPWLEHVELQDSAAPYHDWNERITVECYAPNATARILDGANRIQRITNNYSKISFNFGPTLLAWMRDKMPEIHAAIVEADRISQERFSGHGSAIAQVYNHMILPLANDRDKHTQVWWGIRDFEFRFGRKPEGMWLSETAANTETLEALARLGIRYTILSPYQASRAREIGKRHWKDVSGGRVDPARPYLIKLPSGRSISVFFYDGPVSQAVAFERLLTSGERFANRLLSAFADSRSGDQLVHIATDGESYGHHHRHGEMALAYALQHIEQGGVARLTNYGEYLEKHPPAHEAQIHESSAWSCVHGVGRWMNDCGCNTGRPGWNQGWRTPLRHALDWLRDETTPLYESSARELLKDPWAARNDYIDVILDRGPENIDLFLSKHATRQLTSAEKTRVLKLMELQRHAMLMYTSCGWFFDELSGIETVQVIMYAARVVQLGNELFEKDLEGGFVEILAGAKSNIPDNQDGRWVYQNFVKPAMIDRHKAVAHYAISSVFRPYEDNTRLFSYRYENLDRLSLTSGKTRLVIGRLKVLSEITHSEDEVAYGVLYMGEHNLTGGIAQISPGEAYEELKGEIRQAFENADLPGTIRLLDQHFGGAVHSLRSLFKDEQRKILNEILASTREDLEARFRLIAERYTPLMKFLQTGGVPLPEALQMATDYVLHKDIRKAIEEDRHDDLKNLLEQARIRGPAVLDADISFTAGTRLEELMEQIRQNPDEKDQMKKLQRLAELVIPVPLGLNLWKVQNTCWEMLGRVLPEYRAKAGAGDAAAQEWVDNFVALAGRLGFAEEAQPVAHS